MKFKVAFKEKSKLPAKEVCFSDIFNMIKTEHEVFNGKWFEALRGLPADEAKKEKRKLPMFYMVQFNGTKAVEDDICASHGLICLDIDSEEKAAKAKRDLDFLMKYTLMRFKSPRGGLKWIIRTNITTTDKEEFRAAWDTLNDKLKSKFGDLIDANCCNIGHSCYISHDKDCYFNESCSVLRIDVETRKEKTCTVPREHKNGKRVYDSKRAQKYINDFINGSFTERGYSGTYKAVASILNAGADLYQVVELLGRMASAGALDSGIEPEDYAHKAKDLMRYWESNRGEISHVWYRNEVKEEKVDVLSEFQRIFAAEFAEAERMGF